MEKESQQESRKYTPEYKTKLVMETLVNGRNVKDVAQRHDISPSVLSQWKHEFIKKAPNVFANRRIANKNTQDKPFVTDAYMKIMRQLREEKGLSQETVAKYLGTSQTIVRMAIFAAL